MGIKEDAGELLSYMHHKYIQGESIDAQKISDSCKWVPIRINNAVKYLQDSNYIKIGYLFGNVNGVDCFELNRITPEGISLMEDKPKFKRTFGINIGIFSWQVSDA